MAENTKAKYVYSAVGQQFKRNNDCETDIRSVPKIGIRHCQVFMFFALGFVAFGFRVSLSVGIVAMTNANTSSNTDVPVYTEWTEKNVILSAFFWGYVLPQIFAGWAATHFGAKWFLVGTFTVQSLLSLLTPLTAAHFGARGMMMSRAIQGFCQGFIYPSLTYLLSQWAPAEERSILGTITYASGPCGTVVALLITGLISASWYGWPMVFHMYGVLGLVWVLAMVLFGYNSPSLHPSISKAEKCYIEKSLGHTDEKVAHPTPWKAIVTSLPVWALFITMTGNNFCFWTLLTQIPSYMFYVMNFNIKEGLLACLVYVNLYVYDHGHLEFTSICSGVSYSLHNFNILPLLFHLQNSLLSSLPYLTLWLLSFAVGVTSDVIINKGIMSRTVSRKFFNTMGLFIPALALVILAFTGADQTTKAVILLIIAVGSNSLVFSGCAINHLDLSPNHAGTVMGLCNGVSQSTGAIAPLVVQMIVTTETDQLQWRIVFLITAAFNVLTAIVYVIFGSGEVQPWNDYGKKEKV